MYTTRLEAQTGNRGSASPSQLAMHRGAMGEGWRGEHSLAQVMMGMFEAGGPVSASALRLMETGRHSHRAVDAMRQVRCGTSFRCACD